MSKPAHKKTSNSQLRTNVHFPFISDLPSQHSQSIKASLNVSATPKLNFASFQRSLNSNTGDASKNNFKRQTKQNPVVWDSVQPNLEFVKSYDSTSFIDQEYPGLNQNLKASTSNNSKSKTNIENSNLANQKPPRKEPINQQPQEVPSNVKIIKNASRSSSFNSTVVRDSLGVSENRNQIQHFEYSKNPHCNISNSNSAGRDSKIAPYTDNNSNVSVQNSPSFRVNRTHQIATSAQRNNEAQNAYNLDDDLKYTDINEILNQPEILRVKADKRKVEKDREERDLEQTKQTLVQEKLSQLEERLKIQNLTHSPCEEDRVKKLYERLFNESQKDLELKAVKNEFGNLLKNEDRKMQLNAHDVNRDVIDDDTHASNKHFSINKKVVILSNNSSPHDMSYNNDSLRHSNHNSYPVEASNFVLTQKIITNPDFSRTKNETYKKLTHTKTFSSVVNDSHANAQTNCVKVPKNNICSNCQCVMNSAAAVNDTDSKLPENCENSREYFTRSRDVENSRRNNFKRQKFNQTERKSNFNDQETVVYDEVKATGTFIEDYSKNNNLHYRINKNYSQAKNVSRLTSIPEEYGRQMTKYAQDHDSSFNNENSKKHKSKYSKTKTVYRPKDFKSKTEVENDFSAATTDSQTPELNTNIEDVVVEAVSRRLNIGNEGDQQTPSQLPIASSDNNVNQQFSKLQEDITIVNCPTDDAPANSSQEKLTENAKHKKYSRNFKNSYQLGESEYVRKPIGYKSQNYRNKSIANNTREKGVKYLVKHAVVAVEGSGKATSD